MEYVLLTKKLTKSFNKHIAINNIDMKVKRGDIYGFIGRNGAGKSTFMKLICGMMFPDLGEIELFGSNNLTKGRKRMGTIIEAPSFYPYMTAKENLEYYSVVTRCEKKYNINKILEYVGLSEYKDKKAINFSLGMKQRLAIAIALVGNADFLILDEPINGLDPAGIKEIRELLLRLNRENSITILISSHILGELSKLATRYGIIDNGVLVDEFDYSEAEERCKKSIIIETDDIEKTIQICRAKMGITKLEVCNNKLKIYEKLDLAGEINRTLNNNNILVNRISSDGMNFEEYFISLMGGN